MIDTPRDLVLSMVGVGWLIAFIVILTVVHLLAVKKRAPVLRRRYLVTLGLTLLVTLFVPVLHDPTKFGWVPVSTAYLLLSESLFHSEDDLTRIFILCYAVVVLHQVVSIAAALLLTIQRRKSA
jgi:CDP-diglyceride synthetase